jgi:alkaline phosphatase D
MRTSKRWLDRWMNRWALGAAAPSNPGVPRVRGLAAATVLALGLASLAPLGAVAQAAQVVAGPMAGLPTHQGVTLWVQADAQADLVVEYWPEGKPEQLKRSAPIRLSAAEQFVAQVALFGLAPGQVYEYRVNLGAKPAGKEAAKASPAHRFQTQALWQWRKDPPDFTVLAGSCNYGNDGQWDRPGRPYGDKHEAVFASMAARKPDLTLWLGDNIYFRESEYSSPQGLAARWAQERSRPYLRELLGTGAHLATWDDHDYGPNDSNKSYVFKGEALALHKRYWPNPSAGLPETPGVFGTASYNDVDIFWMDNRYHRDDGRLNDPKRVMYGAEQMAWLKNALLASTATFKLIAGGSQMLTKSPRGDSWLDYPAEQADFLRFLAESRVEGVLFLSGDVHRSELMRVDTPTYPLHELTCSPLTSGVYNDDKLRDRPNLVPGTLVLNQRNFCQIRFEGPRKERQMQLSVVNDQGQTLWTHTLSRNALSVPKP